MLDRADNIFKWLAARARRRTRHPSCAGTASPAAPWFISNPDHRVGYIWSDTDGDGRTQSNEGREVHINLAPANRCSFGLPAPKSGSFPLGDVGVLQSDGSGTQTSSRRYFCNQDTAIVNDVPTEVRVLPNEWGKLYFE